ncbi:peptidylprolyl isomerase [Flavobacterium coralii]|uniref:peptidylprolyl isomerase n=1 Tax=Flavobacterium coralii TaxID=2838017 RepID=UPI000C569B24|nr:peptidylprolyl isomerase [Flavobacterium sp.]|tara:strand:+ start:83933 stop:86038 length:2106 start_codon:yes stop_codon:yes gene_type:complete
MAVLSKIRERSLLLILVIGLSLLAFIVTDVISNGGFGVTKNIGSVNGEDIPAQEFIQKVNDVQARQRGISATQATNMVWNQEVENKLYSERFEKIGLRVGKDHVYNMYAQDPSVAQNPQFLNAIGQFDKNKFNEFLVNMKSTNPDQWRMIERNMPLVEDAAKKQLYLTMVKAGMVATNLDAKAKHKLENDKVNFDYVFVPYATINDDEVKVSDEEITAYMKKNEKKYKAEASRFVEYVLIEDKPSAEDEAELRKSVNEILSPRVVYNEQTKANDTIAGFRGVADVKDFVNKNSDVAYDTTFVTKKSLPIDHAEQIFNLPAGEVYGPYTDNGYLKLTRVVGRRPNASAKVSHILIAFDGSKSPGEHNRTKEEAQAKANEILQKVNANPGSFAQLAAENSDDPGSKNNGGVYDDVMPKQMVPEFDKFLFNNPVGKTGVVETEFGFHVMKVLDKYDAVQLATIAKEIRPSEGTSDELFTKATKLEMDAADKPLEELAKALNLEVKTTNKLGAYDENIQGLGQQRQIVSWAFNKDTEEGDVKKFDVPEGYVIAKLKSKNEKGLMPLDEAKNTVLPILRNEKKAALIKEKMKGDTLEAVAKSSGSSVASATDVTLAAPMVPGVGSEPKVVGKAFGLDEGKTSGLIEGNMGVFMVKTKNVTKAAELPNYNAVATRLKTESRGGVQFRLTTALKDNADIEDNRAEFNQ